MALVAQESRPKLLLMLAGASLFVIGGAFMVASAEDAEGRWTGVACTLFFGLCAAVFLKRLFGVLRRVTIGPEGIGDSSSPLGLIPWSEVNEVWTFRVQRQVFLCMSLRNEDLFLSRFSALQRRLAALNKWVGSGDIQILVSGLDVSPAELLHEASKYARVAA
jgi:hypothetical protein